MRLLSALSVALLLTAASPAWADGQDVANDISREMISPYCPGITLHDCPSDASHDLRTRITGWAEGGMTKDQIWQRLESEFGSDIRATPSTDGSGLWAWVLPIAASVTGIAGAAVLAIRWSRRRGNDPDVATEVTPEQRRRLDTELAALRDQQG
jgi:cytochrome c-type biogenesis protein CcmH/NrfF